MQTSGQLKSNMIGNQIVDGWNVEKKWNTSILYGSFIELNVNKWIRFVLELMLLDFIETVETIFHAKFSNEEDFVWVIESNRAESVYLLAK